MGVFGLGIRLRLAQAGGPMLGLVLRTHLPKHNHHKIRFHFQLDQEVILEAVICCWAYWGGHRVDTRCHHARGPSVDRGRWSGPFVPGQEWGHCVLWHCVAWSCSTFPYSFPPRFTPQLQSQPKDDFIKTTYDISLDSQISLLPRGFSPLDGVVD